MITYVDGGPCGYTEVMSLNVKKTHFNIIFLLSSVTDSVTGVTVSTYINFFSPITQHHCCAKKILKEYFFTLLFIWSFILKFFFLS